MEKEKGRLFIVRSYYQSLLVREESTFPQPTHLDSQGAQEGVLLHVVGSEGSDTDSRESEEVKDHLS